MNTNSAPRLNHTHFVPFRETQPVEADTIAVLLNELHKPTNLDQLNRHDMKFYYDRLEKITDEYRCLQFVPKQSGYTEMKETQLRSLMEVCRGWKETKTMLLLKGQPLPFVLKHGPFKGGTVIKFFNDPQTKTGPHHLDVTVGDRLVSGGAEGPAKVLWRLSPNLSPGTPHLEPVLCT
jgi:hypothetical protein